MPRPAKLKSPPSLAPVVDGSTPNSEQVDVFSLACYGELETLRVYIQAHPEAVNAKDAFGLTPLHEACRFGQTEVVSFLVQQGANVNIPDSNSQTPLHVAAGGGHLATVDELLRLGASASMNAQDVKGRSPLHWASKNEHEQVVKLLLLKGANAQLKDSAGNPALQFLSGFRPAGMRREEESRPEQTQIFDVFEYHPRPIDDEEDPDIVEPALILPRPQRPASAQQPAGLPFNPRSQPSVASARFADMDAAEEAEEEEILPPDNTVLVQPFRLQEPAKRAPMSLNRSQDADVVMMGDAPTATQFGVSSSARPRVSTAASASIIASQPFAGVGVRSGSNLLPGPPPGFPG